MGLNPARKTRFAGKRNEDNELDGKVFSEGEITRGGILDDCNEEDNEWFGLTA